MSSLVQELQSSKEKASSIFLDDSISNFANEKIQLQEEESLKMADILTSLMKHFDQVQEATRLDISYPFISNILFLIEVTVKKKRISQLGPEECEKLDITILKADDDSLQNIIEELRIGLDVVIFIR